VKLALDANVLVAGLAFRGAASLLIEVTFSRTHDFVISEEARQEVLEVLREKFPRLHREAEEALSLLVITVVPKGKYATRLHDFPTLRDPRDAHVLAAAIESECNLLVTWDKDLLSLGTVGRMRIVTPARAMRALESD
jgi:putative PIN family toxin of toxin-antitoxin system